MEELFKRWQELGFNVRELGTIVQNPFTHWEHQWGCDWLNEAEKRQEQLRQLINDTRDFLWKLDV